MKTFDIVVAADEHLGIAKDGDLPWRLPADLKHFKRTTTETSDPNERNAVIMGRKTWESVPENYRPLPGRLNVVLSRRAGYELPDGVWLAGSIDEALRRLGDAPDIDSVFVVGGGAVYTEAIAMAACRRVIITRIAAAFDCDTVFPELGADYELERVIDEGRDNDLDYRIEVWGHTVDAH